MQKFLFLNTIRNIIAKQKKKSSFEGDLNRRYLLKEKKPNVTYAVYLKCFLWPFLKTSSKLFQSVTREKYSFLS